MAAKTKSLPGISEFSNVFFMYFNVRIKIKLTRAKSKVTSSLGHTVYREVFFIVSTLTLTMYGSFSCGRVKTKIYIKSLIFFFPRSGNKKINKLFVGFMDE